MRRACVLMLSTAALGGCASLGSSFPDTPQTPAAIFSGFSYVPLDPLPVHVVDGANCGAGNPRGSILNVLPDNAVRIAVRKLSGSVSGGVAPVQVGVEGNSYQVILDYINADVANLRFRYSGGIEEGQPLQMLTRLGDEAPAAAPAGGGEFVIPVYVGVGLRLTANVTVLRGSVNLTSLGALSAAAQAERVTGSLIVQTLGITGRQVTTALPLPSELNPTTIQNAILALGSVKAIVYDKDTVVAPRVTGIYDPLPNSDQRTINLIVSELASKPIPWKQDCPVGG